VGSRGKFSGPIFPVSTLPKSGNGQDGGWEVEEILKRRKSRFGPPKLREGHDFLIKWKGFTEPTWEHQSSLFQCDEKLREFYEKEGQPFVQVEPSRTLEREFDSISEPDIITGEGVPRMNQISCELGLVDPKAVKSLVSNPIENLLNVGKGPSGSKLKYNLRSAKDRIGLPLISEETNTVQPEQVLMPSGSSEGLTAPSPTLTPDRPEGLPIPQAEVAITVEPHTMKNR
jgi:hypothetical protein